MRSAAWLVAEELVLRSLGVRRRDDGELEHLHPDARWELPTRVQVETLTRELWQRRGGNACLP